MRRSASFVLVSAFVLGAAACGGLDKGAYLRKNEAVVRSLPVFPGARWMRVSSSAYRDDRGLDEPAGPVVGYGTKVIYTLPKTSRVGEVVAFYETRLHRRWRLVAAYDGPVLVFRRRQASVNINLESHRSHVLELDVDHAWYADSRS